MPTGTHYAIRNNLFFESNSSRETVRLAGPFPWLSWEETDLTDPAGRFRIVVDADNWFFDGSLGADWADTSNIMRAHRATGHSAFANVPDLFARLSINPTGVIVSANDQATALRILGGSVSISANRTNVVAARLDPPEYIAASPFTIDDSANLYIENSPTAGANVTITNPWAIWVDAGNSRFDGDIRIDGANAIKANSATEIALQVDNTALTIGSEGSLKIPVKTNTGAPNDALFGNADSCLGYNSFDNTLEVRDGANTYLSVGMAGYVIQRKVPALWATGESWQHPSWPNIFVKKGEGWYHRNQFTEDAVEESTGQINILVDETRCVVCGDEMIPGQQVTMWANGRTRNDDLHAIFGHLHLDANRDFQELRQAVEELTAKINRLESLQPA